MKCLVTGATGFLGQALVKLLLQEGHTVRTLQREKKVTNLPDFEIMTGDIRDEASVTAACKDQEVVFHLAGLVAYTPALREQMEQVNVGGTQNVVNACASQGVQRLVHMSSVVTIGASFDGKQPLTENAPYNLGRFNLGYFETKRRAEAIVLDACRSGKIDAVAVNPGTIYGPGDFSKGSRKTQKKVAEGRFPFYPPGGVNVIHVDDVTAATLASLSQGRSGERYILSGENLLIRDVFRLIAEAAGVPPPRFPLPKAALLTMGWIGDHLTALGINTSSLNSENARVASLFHWYDSTKARRELGLAPRPAREAIWDSVQDLKSQID